MNGIVLSVQDLYVFAQLNQSEAQINDSVEKWVSHDTNCPPFRKVSQGTLRCG